MRIIIKMSRRVSRNESMGLFEQFTETMKSEFSLTSMLRSPRYPLLKKNLGYKIRKDIANANVFVLRPSSELMNFNDRKLAIAYRMAAIIIIFFILVFLAALA